MGNYMVITCLNIKHALGDARRRLLPKGRKNYHKLSTNYHELKVKRPRIERIKRINNYMINYMGNYMGITCLKKTRAWRRKETLATEGTQELP